MPGVAQVADGAERCTTTTYYDTPGLRLTRNGAALRRHRTERDPADPSASDGEDGWVLHLPGLRRASSSSEGGDGDVVEALGPEGEAPPPRLATLARALARGAPLVPVATVRTRVRVHRLHDDDGGVLAELFDEDQEAQGAFGPPHLRRLLTVRGTDDPAVRAAVTERLAGLGATPATTEPAAAVKSEAPGGPDPGAPGGVLALALGPVALAEPDVPPPPATVGVDRPAAELVTADLRAHVGALLEWEAPVQLDRHDAVHKMRVSVRRLRSSLRTFGPLLDDATIRRLEPELSWLAASLGGPRDAEVLRDRLTDRLRALPEPLRRGGADRVLADTLEQNHRTARAALLADLETPRYRQLLVDVVALAARPPLLPEAQRPISKVVPPLLRHAWRKLARRVERAQKLDDSRSTGSAEAASSDGAGLTDPTDEALHRARKSAKQLRYAAEACIRTYGRRAERLASQAEATQEVLGEHQDSVVSQELLVELADEAGRRGEETFTYGVMVGDERARAERSRRAFEPVWEETSRKRHRRWLKA